jgi:hypothetical protein
MVQADTVDRTDSLNLFFCFRWILISFKREFAFPQVIKLWEVLWTNYYSDQFQLFIALAILQSHRDVLMRYLKGFDEVLKYANDLSGSVSFWSHSVDIDDDKLIFQIDLDTTLAQAETLFLVFRGLVEDLDTHISLTSRGAGTNTDPNIGVGIRKRRGSGISIKSEHGDEVVKNGDVAELRGLVKGWGEEVRAEEDLEVVLSLSRTNSRVNTSTEEGRRGSWEARRNVPEVYMPLM